MWRVFYRDHEVVLKESSTLEGFYGECLQHSGLRCFLNKSLVQNLSLQLVSLMASVALQAAKCEEYGDLDGLESSPDAELNADQRETSDRSGRRSRLLAIKVGGGQQKRLRGLDSHEGYLKDIDTHREVDEETMAKVQSILACDWFADEMKAACLSSDC